MLFRQLLAVKLCLIEFGLRWRGGFGACCETRNRNQQRNREYPRRGFGGSTEVEMQLVS